MKALSQVQGPVPLPPSKQEKGYGWWAEDDEGLPCFDGIFQGPAAVERPFVHGFSSGRLNVLVNRWGLVHLFTTEGGYCDFSANSGRVRSGLYLKLIIDGEQHSLVHGDLAGGQIRYGLGYASFEGTWRENGAHALKVKQEFFTAPDREGRMGAEFHLKNNGLETLRCRLRICSDLEPGRQKSGPRRTEGGEGWLRWVDFHAGLGNFHIEADPSFYGMGAEGVTLFLERELVLEPRAVFKFSAQAGYGPGEETPSWSSPEEARGLWKKRLEGVRFSGVEKWVEEEARWSFGQLWSFEAYDSSVGEHYLNLGGYGWHGFGVREVPETAMVVAGWDPDLAFSCLRWTAKLQQGSGNLPHCHAFRRPAPGQVLDTGHEESDNEIWFLMAVAEVIRATGKISFLDEEIPFWEGERGTVLEHLRRGFSWIRRDIGVGRHGLIRIVEGDWNDYLSGVGRGGFGESMMNTGMACAALQGLIPVVESRDPRFAAECREFLGELRSAAAAAFDEKWFVRGFTDDGKPFGTWKEQRLFLNAQSWCVLGGCGSREMREEAMRSALELCHSPLGLTLMSRPYACPPPPSVSDCPIPMGEGENAGIWPQTVHWSIWALAELGWKEEGHEVWKRMSLRNHARLHPDTPFGIFNGPDCYSSHFAGEREGWTQIEMLERAKFPPMNPMVAWQSFSLAKLGAIAKVRPGAE